MQPVQSESLDETEKTGRSCVLVVDDDRMNRMKLSRVLTEQGHDALLAQSGREALAILSERPVDVVLLDLVMPEMDGFATLDAIRADATLKNVVVIIISAVEEMDSIVRCIEMGAEDYLPKPFDPVLLRARLKTSLEKKKLRDLERAYLQQDLVLRQNEKLATLGKLCAGIAHDLNNPAAAAQRSAGALAPTLERLQQTEFQLHTRGLTTVQSDALAAVASHIAAIVEQPIRLDSITYSDRQEEVEDWLDAHEVEHSWEFSGDVVALDFGKEKLEQLAATFGPALLPLVIAWLSATYTLVSLAREIGDATHRISAIVRALKSYSFMDQSPVQQVDVREGLDDTLTMLRHKLAGDITIERDYADDLPRIEAYGSELNQVWTNLIDNAAGAMNGQGRLTLGAQQQGDWVVVSVADTGHGIPEAIQSQIFDPFFTTKPPGEGVGLGLNISHNIIVHKHKGRILVRSQPGQTCFEVRLPIRLASENS